MSMESYEQYRALLVQHFAHALADSGASMTIPASSVPQFDESAFNIAYRRWLCHGEATRPISEEIERIYRQLRKHEPKRCPHGKTAMTCGDCWFNGWKGE